MEYFAESRKLTKILNNERLLVKKLGKKRALKIIQRLDEFQAANNLSEIPSDPPPHCHALKGNLAKKFAVNVNENYRIVFEGYDKNDELSTKRDEIVTVQIVDIEDYH